MNTRKNAAAAAGFMGGGLYGAFLGGLLGEAGALICGAICAMLGMFCGLLSHYDTSSFRKS